MTPTEAHPLVAEVRGLAPHLRSCEPVAHDEVRAAIDLRDLAGAARAFRARGYSLIDITAVRREGQRVVLATVALQLGLLTLESPVPFDAQSFPSLTPAQPALHWLERELSDLTLLAPEGHPQPEPILFPDGEWPIQPPLWPGPAYDAVPLRRIEPRVESEGVFLIPFGPVRSGVVESSEVWVETSGEDMLLVEPRIFYKHRGIERRITEAPLELTPLIAERTAGVMSAAYAIAYCQAIERALAIDVSPRARLIRTVLAELERCFNHFDSIMKLCDDASLSVAVNQFAILKERVLRLNASLTGSRFLRGAVAIGGVQADLDEARVRLVTDELDSIERLFQANASILVRTESFMDRLIGTGTLAPDDAREFLALGPVGRGSGLANDVRALRPYAGYEHIAVHPESANTNANDAAARLEVRLGEIHASFLIIREAIDRLEPGPILTPMPPGQPCALAHGWAEAPDGEVLVYVEFGDEGRLERCHIRPASLMNWGLFHRTTARNVLTDYAFIEHSFGFSQAGCDR